MGRFIFTVNGGWDKLAKSRGKKFLQDIRRTERKLDRLGRWKVLRIRETNRVHEIYERIMRVERLSWKQSDLAMTGHQADYLATICDGLQCAREASSALEWSAYFLELNDRTIAYALTVEYKSVATMLRTSYDRRYASLGPGIYVMNAAIRGILEDGSIKTIDFVSDHAFCGTWTYLRMGRVRAAMTSGRGLSRILLALFSRVIAHRHISRVFYYAREKLGAFPLSDLMTC
jgi:CelD/BcsL family acetyltransferase involved in cellulose biosynthesis